MGTKRVGLARIETLMENLKREIQMGAGTTMVGARRVVKSSTNAAALTLTALDSGACVVMTGTSHTVTLPAPTSGVEFTVVAGAASQQFQLWTAGTNVMYGHMTHSTGGDTVAILSVAAAGKLVGNATSKIGDWWRVWSDGTNWYVEGQLDAAPTTDTF